MIPGIPGPATTDEQLVGRYFLFREIAAGGMASIHLARLLGPVGFGRTVAVKRLHAQFAKEPAFVAMFVDEARIVTSIRHPNVVPVLDVVAVPGHLLLVMEYVHGEAVSKLSAAAHAAAEHVPPGIVAAIGIGMLEGLHAAHEARGHGGKRLDVIHRDVSPQNVLVGADGMVRVLDFGIAKAASQLHETTAGSSAKGKLKYMAPEQVEGQLVDRRIDLWAAGVILWELLAGTRLFVGDNDAVVIRRILDRTIPPPSSVAGSQASFDDVVLKALARNPDERFPDARAMALALEAACPPAPARELSAWVERLSGPALREREAIVHELEAVVSAGMPSIRTQLAFITDQASSPALVSDGHGVVPTPAASSDDVTAVAGGRPAATRAARPTSGHALPTTENGAEPTGPVAIDEAPVAATFPRASSSRALRLAALVAVAAVFVVGALVVAASRGSTPAPAPPATSVTGATLGAPSEHSTESAPAVTAASTTAMTVTTTTASATTGSGTPRRPRPGRPSTDPDGVRLDQRK